jgi:hypothetical protein
MRLIPVIGSAVTGMSRECSGFNSEMSTIDLSDHRRYSGWSSLGSSPVTSVVNKGKKPFYGFSHKSPGSMCCVCPHHSADSSRLAVQPAHSACHSKIRLKLSTGIFARLSTTTCRLSVSRYSPDPPKPVADLHVQI